MHFTVAVLPALSLAVTVTSLLPGVLVKSAGTVTVTVHSDTGSLSETARAARTASSTAALLSPVMTSVAV